MNSPERFRAALAISELIGALNSLEEYEGLHGTIAQLSKIQYKLVNDQKFGPVEICYALYAALGGGTAKPKPDGSEGDEPEETVGSPGIDFSGVIKTARRRKNKSPKKREEKVKQSR